MKDTGWRPMQTSLPGDQERIVSDIDVPDVFQIRIWLDIFDTRTSFPDRAEPFLAHARIHVGMSGGHDLFRLSAPTMEEAKKQVEQGLVGIGEQLLKAFKK